MAGRYLLYPPVKVQAPPMSYQPAPPLPPSSSDTSFPILAISILGMVTTAVLLVSYYVFVIKCCLNWRRSDVISRLSDARYSRQQRRLEDAPLEIAGGRRGLEEAVIRAIPVFRFRKGSGSCGRWEGGKAGAFQECAVCLNEFAEGERLRRLPGCSHAFHIDCIDVWLQSSANCPLCRSDVTGVAVIRTGQAIQPLAQGLHRHSELVMIEVRDDGSDGAGDVVTPRSEASMQPQQQQAAASPVPQRQLSRRKTAEQRMEQSKGQGRFHHVCSMGDECIDVRRVKDEQFCVQPMRRSFSVDSSSDRQLYLRVQEILQSDPRLYPREIVGAGEGGSGSGSVLAAGRVRRSLFSFGRGSRSNAVLPMAMEP